MRGALIGTVVVSFTLVFACDDAEVADCLRENEVVVDELRYCVFPGTARSSTTRCPVGVRYLVDVPNGYVCASTPHEAEELPREVCALFRGGCTLDALDASMDASTEDSSVDSRDAGPELDARRPDTGRPSDAGPDASLDAPALDMARADTGASDSGGADAGACFAPPARIDDLAVGANHVCVIADGRLHCWGSNLHGEVGVGTGVGDVLAPTRIGTETEWSRVAAGEEHTCAVRLDGTLWCWGQDRDSRLGLPDGTYATPTRVGDRTDWADVGAGNQHTCGINRDDELRCWGNNEYGQLGNGTLTEVATSDGPAIEPATAWRSVDGARTHTCAITRSESLRCWGANGTGMLGVGAGAPDGGLVAPSAAIGGLDWLQVEVGGVHSCARESPDRVHCWGSGSGGRLGLGFDESDRATPAMVASIAALGRIDLAVGDSHTCAIGDLGVLRCFGHNDSGQLGNGTRTEANTPTPILGERHWERVAAGEHLTCAIDENEIFCWGEGLSGPIAGAGADPTVPTRICLPPS